MKKIIFLLLLSTLLFSSVEKVTVQLEWKHQFEFAGFYAALEKGYYKDVGIEAEIKEFNNNISITDDVLNGKAAFGVSSSSLILERLKNKPVVLLASYFKQNALALVTKPDIKKPGDLKDKKIMALSSEMERTSLGAMLKDSNIEKSDYTLVNHNFGVDKFVNGEVDAMSVFITSQPFLLDTLGVKFNILNPSDYGIYSYDVELFTSEKFAKEHPLIVNKFLLATNKGWEYALNNKEEIVELIYNKYSKQKTKEALLYEAHKTEDLFKRNIFQIGAVVPELIKLNIDMYKKLGLVKKDVGVSDIYINYFLKKNKSSLSQYNFTKEELYFLKKHKIIKVANVSSIAPYDFYKNGKPQGLSVDYMNLLASKINLKTVYKTGHWNELLNSVKNNEIDIMLDIAKTKSREEYLNFTSSYTDTLDTLYAKEGSPYKSLSDLNNKTLAISKGFYQEELIKNLYPNIKILLVKSPVEALKAVAYSEADATIGNFAIYNFLIAEHTITNIKPIFEVKEDGFSLKLHFATHKSNTTLLNILEKVKSTIPEDEIIKLKAKWLSNTQEDEKINLTIEEKKYLTNKKKITICIDPEWMPFESFKKGKHVGLTADYFKIFQTKIETPFILLKTRTWSESLEFAKQRKCDILSLAMATSSRKEYLNFTSPYLSIPLVLATKSDVSFISDFSTLTDQKLGIPTGYAFVEILKDKYPNLNIVEVKNIKDGLTKVKEGKLFGYIGTLASVGYMLQTEFTGELKIAGKFDDKWTLGVGVRNDDKILLEIFEKIIQSIKETQHREILNKWISIKYENIADYKLVWKIIFISIIILLIISFWNRKLSTLNIALKKAKNKAEEATLTKSNFLANMSHEIRTPMNSIISMVYLIEQTKLNEMQKRYIKNIQTASNSLLTLLNDILDYSKIEAKKLELDNSDFNLIELLDNISNILKIKADEKGLDFKIDYDKDGFIHLHGDSQRLSQILTNLLSNAIKFTDNGKVELIVEQLDGIFRFSVCDTGIGLTQEEIDKVFLSFTQADTSTTRRYGGTGLGLSISKQLAELMNGKIWVESVVNQGSKFIFEVPLERSDITEKKKTFSDNAVNISELGITSEKLAYDDSKELFNKLEVAVASRRPHLCEPIIQQMQNSHLSQEDKELFEEIKKLVNKYKFNEAKELLHAKKTDNPNS
ncbi:ABC transporter substrate-binding protein [Candidatus Sulfurimonas baltica]|uniref:Sensory/regulatory protein RpfC n=1 Tax=Candidatus Sulfurimonas baltica TaxID=2740404 RepID=A0A7S7LVV7_9BACT|nr:transporter substrate-binding domain-containing protein [Candidatus Sulfurimonas baltica]QOY52403.1 transporter substrate-binding domain-containing protein [Candidatus Sulfurimonas baltica]